MTTNTTINETFMALEDTGTWATAEELDADEQDLHWLTDKLWVERKEVEVRSDGSPVWAFRARVIK